MFLKKGTKLVAHVVKAFDKAVSDLERAIGHINDEYDQIEVERAELIARQTSLAEAANQAHAFRDNLQKLIGK
jgi:hypothetical protein